MLAGQKFQEIGGGGGRINLRFYGIFINTGSRPGHIFGLARVQGNASHVNTLLSLLLSCGFRSWHHCSGLVNQIQVGGQQFWSEADSWLKFTGLCPSWMHCICHCTGCSYTHQLHGGLGSSGGDKQYFQQPFRAYVFIQMSNHLCYERNLIIFCYCVFVVWVHIMTGSACWYSKVFYWACWGRGNSIPSSLSLLL